MNPTNPGIFTLIVMLTLALNVHASYTARAALSMSSSSAPAFMLSPTLIPATPPASSASPSCSPSISSSSSSSSTSVPTLELPRAIIATSHDAAPQLPTLIPVPRSALLQQALTQFPEQLISLIEAYAWEAACIGTYETEQLTASAYAFGDHQLLLPTDRTIAIVHCMKNSAPDSITLDAPAKSVIPISQHRIAVATTDDLIRIYRVKSKTSVLKITNYHNVSALIPATVGQLYIKKTGDSLHHINADTGSHLSNPIYNNTANGYLFSIPDNGITLCLQSANKKEIVTIIVSELPKAPAMTCLVEVPPKRLATGYSDGSLQIWNFVSKTKHTIKAYASKVTALQLLHNGLLISGSESDGPLKLWDIHTRRCIATIEGLWISGIQIIDNTNNKHETVVANGHWAGVRQLIVLPNGVLAVIFTESNWGDGFQTIQLFA